MRRFEKNDSNNKGNNTSYVEINMTVVQLTFSIEPVNEANRRLTFKDNLHFSVGTQQMTGFLYPQSYN